MISFIYQDRKLDHIMNRKVNTYNPQQPQHPQMLNGFVMFA